MRKQRILLIGPAPRNIGGVSMHIRRLMSLMDDEFDFDFVDEGRRRYDGLFNIRSCKFFTYFKKMWKADRVHIHSGPYMLRLFHILMARILCRKVILTIHNNPCGQSFARAKRLSYRLCDKVVAVNDIGHAYLMGGKTRQNYFMMPAFLPPVSDLEPPLAEEVVKLIDRIRAAHGTIIVSNAFRLVDRDGEELYGYDLCIEAMAQIRARRPDMYMLFVIGDTAGSEPMLSTLNERARELGVTDRFIFIPQTTSFIRLLKYADLAVRPTNTDGDALTVREALWSGVPCVASDVVKRPEGTVLFKNRDVDDFANAICNFESGSVPAIPSVDYKSFYRHLYE